MLGLGALFLSFSVEYAPEIYSLLFGEVLGDQPQRDGAHGRCSARSASPRSRCSTGRCCSPRSCPDSAQARGVTPYSIELGFLVVVALATTMTVPVVGTAADLQPDDRAARRRPGVHRPAAGRASALSVAIALVHVVWAAIALSYQTNWPVGFFVGSISAASYAAGRGWAALRRNRMARSARLAGAGADGVLAA